jgi:hypothetical protein
MRLTRNIFDWVPVIMVTYSLVSIIILFQIDTIVNENLYLHGLQFSPEWATPYWNTIRIGFAMSWMAIFTVVASKIYSMTRKNKEENQEKNEKREKESRDEKLWHRYRLSDGSTIKVKYNLKSAKRLEKLSPDGMPVYVVESDNIVQVLSAPLELIKKTKKKTKTKKTRRKRRSMKASLAEIDSVSCVG